MKFYPYKKVGAGEGGLGGLRKTVLAILKGGGGTTSFGVVCT